MKFLKAIDEAPKKRKNLRNFGLSVEEIKIIKAIRELTQSLQDIEHRDNQPGRPDYFRHEISKLELQLDEIRENTLIR